MSTVAEIITQFQRRYPGCEADHALELFNQVHRELCARSQLRNAQTDILLVQGQGEYDLDPLYIKIHEAYYCQNANTSSWIPLIERSLDEYVVKRRGWRLSNTETQPTEYYTTSAIDDNTSKAQIGFWLVPPVTSSFGFPCVRIFCTTAIDLAADDDAPPQILNNNIYLYGMWAKWLAEEQSSSFEEFTKYDALAEREMNRNVAHIKDIQTNANDVEFVPNMLLRTRRVI